MEKKSKWYFSGILFVGAVIGIAFLTIMTNVVHWAGSVKFCGEFCHSMDAVYAAYKAGSHYQNSAGVSAGCSDCHLLYHSNDHIGPVDYTLMLVDKMKKAQASMFGEMRGTMNTLEKQVQMRHELSENVINQMKAEGFSTCQGCHKFDRMYNPKKPYVKQIHLALTSPDAHEPVNCIECHKTVAHNYAEGDKTIPGLEEIKAKLEAGHGQAQEGEAKEGEAK